jgi:soluble lytic murein transglycosylase
MHPLWVAIFRSKLLLVHRAFRCFLAVSLIVVFASPAPSAFAQASKKRKTPAKATASHRASQQKTAQKKAADAARARRMKQAFVTSSDLKPMARQLFETHSKAAYAGVEKYAKTHKDSDAGALAWLVLGYAHSQENDHPKAIDALKNAKPHARDLSDYVDYILGQAYRADNQPKEALVALGGFTKNYPDSIFARDAALAYANALMTTNSFDQAADVLEEQRKPARADIELAIGKAYLGAGNNDKALAAFRHLYYEMPLSAEADEAGNQIRRLANSESYGTREMRKTRADLLARGKKYWQAASEYRQLAGETPNDNIILIALANSLYRSDKLADARQVLGQMQDATGEANAQRLYLLTNLSKDDDSATAAYLDQLRQASPNSGWFQEALLNIGNRYLLRRDFEHAAALYQELADRFPAGRYGPSSHWKAAWLDYRLGKSAEAKQRFEEQITLFPRSNEVPNALYWRARLAEDEKQLAKARAYYLKLAGRYRNYYYALLARDRLGVLKRVGAPEEDAVLDKVPELNEKVSLQESADGVTDIHLQKARLLSNGALFDFAIKELQPAANDPEKPWVTGEIVRMQVDAGRPFTALETLKRAIPNYLSVDPASIPKSFLEILFPRSYWQALKENSRANDLDPYLVASLIRQESEFNPGAISPANAYGLMQILPEVGRGLAREVKLKPYSASRLLEPEANIKLGTRYFREMVNSTGGVEYALAAYNAGSTRVSDWKSTGPFRDTAEFVESIPFTETREYVQAIVRNVAVYKKIYEND